MGARFVLFIKFGPLVDHGESIFADKLLLGFTSNESSQGTQFKISYTFSGIFRNMSLVLVVLSFKTRF